jgi:multiple sugar transport system permease protein
MKMYRKTPLFFVGPSLVYLLVVIGYPLVFTLFISFINWYRLRPGSLKFVGLGNYINWILQPDFWSILFITVKFVVGTVVLQFVIGLGLALILNDKRFIGRSYFLPILLVPIAISPVVTGQLWRFIYEPAVGPINTFLRLIGIIKPPLWLASPSLALPSLILAHAWQWTPLTMLLIFSGFQTIPESIYEAAKLDGASPLKIHWYMTIPLARNMIMIALILSTIISFKVFDLISLTTYGGPGLATEILSITVYKTGLIYFNLSSAAALSQILLLIVLVFINIFTRQIQTSK